MVVAALNASPVVGTKTAPVAEACRNDSCSPWWNPAWLERQKIEFSSDEPSANFRAYIAMPDVNVSQISKTRFVQGGTLLASQVDEAGIAGFWVLLSVIEKGLNSFYVYHENPSAPDPMELPVWEDAFAVFHAPHLGDQTNTLPMPIGDTTPVPGFFNTATEFYGGNAQFLKMSIPNDIESELFPTFSLSAWVLTKNNVPNVWQTIVSRQFSNDPKDDFFFGIKDEKARGCVSEGGPPFEVMSTISLDSWNLITMVYNGRDASMYLNGQLNSVTQLARLRSESGRDLIIGGNQNFDDDSITDPFIGIIDELRITKTILSSEEIKLQFESTDSKFFSLHEIETK